MGYTVYWHLAVGIIDDPLLAKALQTPFSEWAEKTYSSMGPVLHSCKVTERDDEDGKKKYFVELNGESWKAYGDEDVAKLSEEHPEFHFFYAISSPEEESEAVDYYRKGKCYPIIMGNLYAAALNITYDSSKLPEAMMQAIQEAYGHDE